MKKPGDDSTVLVAEVTPHRVVNMLAGPPKEKADDERMVRDYMRSQGKKGHLRRHKRQHRRPRIEP